MGRRISSTGSPEIFMTGLPSNPLTPSAPSFDSPAKRQESALALLLRLELSLGASHQAMLTRDLSHILNGSAEQASLIHDIKVLLPSQALTSDSGQPYKLEADRAAQLRRAGERVLILARMQAALLRRAQRWQRILAHLLAGSDAIYAAPPVLGAADRGRSPHSSGVKGGSSQCPV